MTPPIDFEVQDMSCAHCVRAITEAVAEVNPQARVQVDLQAKQVRIEGAASSEAGALGDAIREAGFTPLPK